MTKQSATQVLANTADAAAADNAPMTIIAERFKTKLCRGWLQQGYCPYQSKCMFAHGEEERRTSAMNIDEGITTEEAIREFKRQQLKKRRQLAAAAVIPAPRSGIRRNVSAGSAPPTLVGGGVPRPQVEPERFAANLRPPSQTFERSASTLSDATPSPSALALQPLRAPGIFFSPLPQPAALSFANSRTSIISFPRRPEQPPSIGPAVCGALDGSSNCSSANPSELWDVDDYPTQQTNAASERQGPATRRRSSDGGIGAAAPVAYTPPNIYLSWEEPPSGGYALAANAGPMAGLNASRTPSMTLGVSATSDDVSATSTSSKNVRYRHDPYGWSVDARSPDMETSWT